MSELPELPPPDVWVREDFGLGDSTVHRGWSEDQMLSFAREAMEIGRKAGLEEAAQEAESFRSNERAVNLTAREIATGEIAEDIASAIRALSDISSSATSI